MLIDVLDAAVIGEIGRATELIFTSCLQRWFLQGTDCVRCPVGCWVCLDLRTCLTCEEDDNKYVVIGGQCVKPILPCTALSPSDGSCISCIKPLFYSTTSGCTSCLHNNCDQCSDDRNLCVNCARPFGRIPLGNGTCRVCHQDSCYHCSFTDPSICI